MAKPAPKKNKAPLKKGASAPGAQKSGSGILKLLWRFRILVILGVAAAAYTLYKRPSGPMDLASPVSGTPPPTGGSSAPAPAAPQARLKDWGPEVKLEKVSSFKVDFDVLDIRADAEGVVYVLTGSQLRSYKDGKLLKFFDMPGSPWRSMGFDGTHFYVTDFNSPGIGVLDKGLSNSKSFAVQGAARFLGIAATKSGTVYVSEVSGKAVYVLDSAGVKKKKLNGPLSDKEGDGFFADLQIMPSGEILQSNQYGSAMLRMTPGGSVSRLPKCPWDSPSYERAAIVGDKIYVNVYKEYRIAIMDLEGQPLGWVKKDAPQMIGAGADGFVYVRTENEIEKLKPLKVAVEAKP